MIEDDAELLAEDDAELLDVKDAELLVEEDVELLADEEAELLVEDDVELTVEDELEELLLKSSLNSVKPLPPPQISVVLPLHGMLQRLSVTGRELAFSVFPQ